ncbi:uncharacterized protein LOC108050652 isoform X1 [Drosophila rhopaloa]|uniref:Uncharacterized protein n=1 Tax=Drosophila rhopaloa TaxID=1041015 RepID=A0ABM5J1U7_DRORH|nr:uncharacterized protein LOC108050652 isoform X1 [Drosophila rhopaloa]
MQRRSGLFVAICLWISVNGSLAYLQHEGEAINKCLKNYGGLTPENNERLGRFKEWSENYEEIPCFTRCYLSDMFDLYNNQTGFDKAKVEDAFGSPVYEACRRKLELDWGSSQSSCQHAYQGFHCIANMDGHPFTVIDSMANVTLTAKNAMKECLQDVHRNDWSRFAAYANYPVNEPIPCFSHCFLSKLHIFDERTRRWQLRTMKQQLGVPAKGARISGCHRQSGKDRCATYYKQFTCYAMAV